MKKTDITFDQAVHLVETDLLLPVGVVTVPSMISRVNPRTIHKSRYFRVYDGDWFLTDRGFMRETFLPAMQLVESSPGIRIACYDLKWSTVNGWSCIGRHLLGKEEEYRQLDKPGGESAMNQISRLVQKTTCLPWHLPILLARKQLRGEYGPLRTDGKNNTCYVVSPEGDGFFMELAFQDSRWVIWAADSGEDVGQPRIFVPYPLG